MSAWPAGPTGLAGELARVGLGRSSLAGSTTEGGSWWPDFVGWLEQRGGGDKARPRRLGAAGLPPLDPAPGSYVLDR